MKQKKNREREKKREKETLAYKYSDGFKFVWVPSRSFFVVVLRVYDDDDCKDMTFYLFNFLIAKYDYNTKLVVSFLRFMLRFILTATSFSLSLSLSLTHFSFFSFSNSIQISKSNRLF